MDPSGAPAQQTRARHRRGTDTGRAPERHDRAGHGHDHGPPAPADRRVRLVIAALLVPCALATLIGLVLLFPAERPGPGSAGAGTTRLAGHVTATAETACDDGPTAGTCRSMTVRMEEGPLTGRDVVTLESVVRGQAGYDTGDDVVLVAGEDAADPSGYQIVDFRRGTPLLLLALLFAAAVVALGRWRGVAALTALGLTGVVLAAFVLPAILSGRNPLAVAVVGSCAIMFAALYLTHGVTARTSAALLGTLASLVLIGLLGVAFAAATRLTGADEDTANLATVLGAPVDGRGLVLAGLVIGALGALDDVTVTQASAVWELRAADPDLSARQVFHAAMRIGRDHVGATVNTLVLAYAGSALPLLLLFSVAERRLADTLTTQVIATEIVRSLVGSIGLVAAVPITTALAVAVTTSRR